MIAFGSRMLCASGSYMFIHRVVDCNFEEIPYARKENLYRVLFI